MCMHYPHLSIMSLLTAVNDHHYTNSYTTHNFSYSNKLPKQQDISDEEVEALFAQFEAIQGKLNGMRVQFASVWYMRSDEDDSILPF
mmetsp:Transcript_23650/g.28876  ORF Transcript_23650/g.28876 Transcript_23650/m.28876 type:complete len:87 (-) Transcript_23650:112-372(-)